MADIPFPKSLPDFQHLFPNDAACAKYLSRPFAGAMDSRARRIAALETECAELEKQRKVM